MLQLPRLQSLTKVTHAADAGQVLSATLQQSRRRRLTSLPNARALRQGDRLRSVAVFQGRGTSAGLVSQRFRCWRDHCPTTQFSPYEGGPRSESGSSSDALLDPSTGHTIRPPARPSTFRRRVAARGRRAHAGARRRAIRRAIPERQIRGGHSRAQPPDSHRIANACSTCCFGK